MAAVQRYARDLGLAFQIRDDMLDVEGDEATLGKPIGSDARSERLTFVDPLKGRGGPAEQLVVEHTPRRPRRPCAHVCRERGIPLLAGGEIGKTGEVRGLMDYDLPNYHLGNLILILSVVSWAMAQVLKVVIQLVLPSGGWTGGVSWRQRGDAQLPLRLCLRLRRRHGEPVWLFLAAVCHCGGGGHRGDVRRGQCPQGGGGAGQDPQLYDGPLDGDEARPLRQGAQGAAGPHPVPGLCMGAVLGVAIGLWAIFFKCAILRLLFCMMPSAGCREVYDLTYLKKCPDLENTSATARLRPSAPACAPGS